MIVMGSVEPPAMPRRWRDVEAVEVVEDGMSDALTFTAPP